MTDTEVTLSPPARETGRRAPTLAEIAIFALMIALMALAGRIFLIAFGGLLLGVLFYSVAKWTAAASRLPYGFALALVMVLFMSLGVAVFWLVGSRLASQANELTEAVSRSLKQIADYLDRSQWGQRILEQSPEWGKAIAQGNIPSRISDLASSIVDFVVSTVIMLFVGLYCAAEPNTYSNGLVRLVPIEKRARAREVLQVIVYNLRWWILGQLFAMACVGVITGIGLWIAGTPLALTLGVLAAVLEIIPNIGPVLWLVPASLVALTADTDQVVRVVAIYGVTHMVESYVLIPLVQRRTVWLPPVLSILAVVVLGLFAGFLGLLVAAPLALVVMLLVKMLYVEDWLGDRTLRVPGERKH
ncbi:MAG TPA: AI-2E family transporter [Pirellulales bacterium]|jgi:predicted PurR-regulated permease PerM|nr:AI-2E family transporter [Pirellulales bacterium]